MNRASRRALARVFGRAKASPDPDRFAQLELQNQALQARLDSMEAKHDALPGLVEGRRDWFVLVDGERVELKALPPIEWLKANDELPSFLFTFATNRLAGGSGLDADALTRLVELARRWITASAVSLEGVHLDRLTVIEAEHAVAHIAALNGVTDSLRAWFRQRLDGVAAPAPRSEGVRGEAEQPAGSALN